MNRRNFLKLSLISSIIPSLSLTKKKFKKIKMYKPYCKNPIYIFCKNKVFAGQVLVWGDETRTWVKLPKEIFAGIAGE